MNLFHIIKSYYKDSLYRNSYFIFATSIISSLSGFIFWIIAARMYSVSDTGLAVALISASGLIISISKLGLDVSIIRFLGSEENKKNLVNNCLTVLFISTSIISAIFILGIDIWAAKLDFIKNNYIYCIMFILFTNLFCIYIIFTNVFIALRESKYSFYQNLIIELSRIPLVLIAAVLIASGIFVSWGLSLLIGLLFSIYYFRRIIPNYLPYPIIEMKVLKRIANFSISNYIVNFFSGAPALIIPILVLENLTSEDSAYFYMTYTLANILFMIPGALSTSLFAEGSNDESSIFSNLKKAIKQSYLLLIPGIIGLILLGDKILLIFGKAYSANGYYLLLFFALSGLFVAVNSFYYMYLRLTFKMKKIIIITILVSSAIIGLTYLLLACTNLGIIGVGIAYLVVNVLMGIYSIYEFRNIIRN